MKKAVFVLSVISIALSVVHLILSLIELYLRHKKQLAKQ